MSDESNDDGSSGRIILARGAFRLRRRRGGSGRVLMRAAGAADGEASRGAPTTPPGSGAAQASNTPSRSGQSGPPDPRNLAAEPVPSNLHKSRMVGLKIEKWQALGNDFLLVWDAEALDPRQTAYLCHRNLGVGADGILFLKRHEDIVRVRLLNRDGTEAEYSGNGFCCAIASANLRQRPTGRLRLVGSQFSMEGFVEDGQPVLVMDPGNLDPSIQEAPEGLFDGTSLQGILDPTRAYRVRLGNPHLIVLCDTLEGINAPQAAQLDTLRTPSPFFTHGVNVSLAIQDGPGRYTLRTWERGVGLTRSCASAATALFHLLRHRGETGGGALEVSNFGGVHTLREAKGKLQLRAGARRVFTAVLEAGAVGEL